MSLSFSSLLFSLCVAFVFCACGRKGGLLEFFVLRERFDFPKGSIQISACGQGTTSQRSSRAFLAGKNKFDKKNSYATFCGENVPEEPLRTHRDNPPLISFK
jgi:hypothetical protein